MSFKLKNHNIIFIHPPKCGGSSIAEALKSVDGIGEKAKKPGTEITLSAHKKIKELNKIDFTADEYFVTVRNPYDRFYSYYHFLIEWDKKRLNGELPMKGQPRDKLINRIASLEEMKFDGWVSLLINEKVRTEWHKKHQLLPPFTNQIDWFKGQTNKPVHVFKIEDGEVWKYLNKKGYNVKRQHIKKSTYRTVPYTEAQKDLVYKFFIDDFEELKYER